MRASTLRAYTYVETAMLQAAMPRLAALEPRMSPVVETPGAPALRVSVAEVAGTRLFGFRRSEEV